MAGVNSSKQKKSTIEISGKVCELPIVVGTEGEIGVDVGTLRSQTKGIVTIDNAFMNTAACESKITFLDGEKGVLRHRGYAIEELAEYSHFIEMAYLLIFGELPCKKEWNVFLEKFQEYRATEPCIKEIIKCFPKNMHPMAMLSACIVSLSGVSQHKLDQGVTKETFFELVPFLICQIKNIAAYCYRHTQGLSFIDSKMEESYSSDFLVMMSGNKSISESPQFAKALDVIFMLHADHEQNCSTSSVRLVGSSQANLYAVISAGVNALWGPLHGGANQAVVHMLEDIYNNGYSYQDILRRAKDKNDSFKLMGFGHRVYKNFDPRSKIIKKMCDQILSDKGDEDPLLSIAKGLEQEALKDTYFIERKLYPNVDFYSGIILRSLGIPTNMFTVMFAIGRLPGWLAQWKEMIESPVTRISRPRQIYQGYNLRKYTPLNERS